MNYEKLQAHFKCSHEPNASSAPSVSEFQVMSCCARVLGYVVLCSSFRLCRVVHDNVMIISVLAIESLCGW
jgi:hypothetical protein